MKKCWILFYNDLETKPLVFEDEQKARDYRLKGNDSCVIHEGEFFEDKKE